MVRMPLNSWVKPISRPSGKNIHIGDDAADEVAGGVGIQIEGEILDLPERGLRRSRLTEKVMRLFRHSSATGQMQTHTATTRIATTCAEHREVHIPLAQHIVDGAPQKMGIYSWAATLTAATIRLHTTKKP